MRQWLPSYKTLVDYAHNQFSRPVPFLVPFLMAKRSKS